MELQLLRHSPELCGVGSQDLSATSEVALHRSRKIKNGEAWHFQQNSESRLDSTANVDFMCPRVFPPLNVGAQEKASACSHIEPTEWHHRVVRFPTPAQDKARGLLVHDCDSCDESRLRCRRGGGL